MSRYVVAAACCAWAVLAALRYGFAQPKTTGELAILLVSLVLAAVSIAAIVRARRTLPRA